MPPRVEGFVIGSELQEQGEDDLEWQEQDLACLEGEGECLDLDLVWVGGEISERGEAVMAGWGCA